MPIVSFIARLVALATMPLASLVVGVTLAVTSAGPGETEAPARPLAAISAYDAWFSPAAGYIPARR